MMALSKGLISPDPMTDGSHALEDRELKKCGGRDSNP